MVQVNAQLSTGLPGLDRVLRGVIPGDNIVWQIDSIDDYAAFIGPYCESARRLGRRLTYFRFAEHPPLVADQPGVETHRLNPADGFEAFIAEVHQVIGEAGRGAWHVFDCLSDLASAWRSDTMLGNFFLLTCPYLYDVDAIAYFALMRRFHAPEAVAPIMDTTQVFLDVYHHKGQRYLHPLKVQHRHSPTMYMLHVWQGEQFLPVAESSTTGEILSVAPCLPTAAHRAGRGIWHDTFRRAEETLRPRSPEATPEHEVDQVLDQLLRTVVTRDPRMLELLRRYLTLEDVMAIGNRIIGTGLIGGKAVGMLLGRAVLKRADPRWQDRLEIHDSFYIGSDVFYSFLVQNGLWWESQKHRHSPEFLHEADYARRRTVVGKFPDAIVEQFRAMLDYFGQSPIIVRSSSLLEDSFGHSFAGKYASVFLASQGSPTQRLQDFMAAVRTIYASTMSEEALTYRHRRGMLAQDEQMALLVQRVSGAMHDHLFFPDLGGVGFSYNPYVWSNKIDPRAGVLRLVFGLGTRAVDRTDDDFPRVVALNAPERRPTADYDDVVQYAQRRVDVLDLEANQLVAMEFEDVVGRCDRLPIELVASRDERLERYPATAEREAERFPWVLTFDKLLGETEFVADMRAMLRTLEEAYGTPVDVEYTTNFRPDGDYLINLVQCRPLQVQSEGAVTEAPERIPAEDLVLEAHGAIIGHSRVLDVHRVIYVVPSVYGQMPPRDRYAIARLVGRLVHHDASPGVENIMLLGPGRWGTSMPSLGVPITFHEISAVTVLSELVMMHDHLVPDVSLGTHLFNELVEADILYFALFHGHEGNRLNMAFLDQAPNRLADLLPDEAAWAQAVRVIDAADTGPLLLNANTPSQTVVCYRESPGRVARP
jgi:hypothetical protein